MKKTTKLLVTSLAAMLAVTNAFAEQKLRPTVHDARIKSVVYQEDNVFPIYGQYGYSSHVLFDKDELIEKVDIGDAQAWVVTASDNHLFIKPALDSNTNMTVVTNLHNYSFRLETTQDKSHLTYKLEFKYPEIEQAIRDLAIKKHAARAKSLRAVDPQDINWSYSYAPQKTSYMSPKKAFDDGSFTYFLFDDKKELPAIFAVTPDGKEAIVNFDIESGYVVIHQVGKAYTLRSGKEALMIFNDSFKG